MGWGIWSLAKGLCKAPEGTGSSCWAEEPAPKWDVPKPHGAGGGHSCRGTVMLDSATVHPQCPGHLLKFSWTRCSLRYCSSDSRNFMSGMMDCSERKGALGRAGGGGHIQQGTAGRGAEHCWLEPARREGPEGLPPTVRMGASCAQPGPAAGTGIR